jgi:hypothetical protein
MPEETQSRLGRPETWRHRYAKCGALIFLGPQASDVPPLNRALASVGSQFNSPRPYLLTLVLGPIMERLIARECGGQAV